MESRFVTSLSLSLSLSLSVWISIDADYNSKVSKFRDVTNIRKAPSRNLFEAYVSMGKASDRFVW